MSSTQIPRKRYRGSNSPNDSDEQGRTPGGAMREATYLQTPPPSSPPKDASASSQGHDEPEGARVFTFEQHTARDVYLYGVRKSYPCLDIANLTDFEVMTLSSGGYKGSMDGIQQWLEHELDLVVKLHGGGKKAILDMATEACNERVAAVGLKPSVGATNVSIRPVTDSGYSMRLWPASEELWCLDFIDSTTQEPINKPFKFELWAEPMETFNRAPWLPISVLSKRLRSMEFGFGLTEDEIEEGEEKFVLMDGQTCLLKRTGCHDIRFTVPNRHPVAVDRNVEIVTF